MNFWGRAKYYLIGLGIGTIITVVIFGVRGCSWTPENRVFQDIQMSTILINERVKCELACNNISDGVIYDTFMGEGSVLFKESEPRRTPKMYIVEAGDESFKLQVTIDDSESTQDTTILVTRVEKLKMSGKSSCDCASVSDSTYVLFSKPEERITRDLFFTENKEIKFNQRAKCGMECYGLSSSDISTFIDSKPKLIKEASDYAHQPHPYFAYENEIDGVKYRFIFEDAGRRTRLIEIIAAHKSCLCDEL